MPSPWTHGSQVVALALCGVLYLADGMRAQSVADPEPVPQAPQAQREPLRPVANNVTPFPLDIAGYLAARNLESDDLADRNTFREYSGSIFLSKTIGRWLFHAEVNANTAPEWDSEGI